MNDILDRVDVAMYLIEESLILSCKRCSGTTVPDAKPGQVVWFGAVGMCPDCCR